MFVARPLARCQRYASKQSVVLHRKLLVQSQRTFAQTNSRSLRPTDNHPSTSAVAAIQLTPTGESGSAQPQLQSSSSSGGGGGLRDRIARFFSKANITAAPGFNRWWVPPASMSIHLCIGSVYAWSIFNAPLCRELGVVASAANDWTLSQVVPIFSTAILCLGLSAAFAGKWLEVVGPRLVGTVSAACWGGGFLVGGLGIAMHNLPLVYAGYGLLGGIGLGLGYVSPVSTLLRWFPDRRGMATGMAIMGFGGGALIGAPLMEGLLAHFARAPTYLGRLSDVKVMTAETGRRYIEATAGSGGAPIGSGSGWQEVVVATAPELARLRFGSGASTLSEGVYLVGTGSTGAAATFLSLGAIYFIVMMCGSLSYRVPAVGWTPVGWTPPVAAPATTNAGTGSSGAAAQSMISTANVHVDVAHRTPQFWLLWTNLCCNVTAGIGVIGVAKTLMTDLFSSSAGAGGVSPKFATGYVLGISIANMIGRFGWASISDWIGRKRAFAIFFGAGIPLYCSIPYAAQLAAEATSSGVPSTVPLALFCSSSLVIFSMYGGGFASIPAYLADIFGTHHVGAIHGRLLTAWSVAGVAGPLLITNLRHSAWCDAVKQLASVCDPERFQSTFGVPITSLSELITSNSITIQQLLAIAPAGTADPTPFLYDSTMYAMSGLLAIAFVSNALVRPVHPRFHMPPPVITPIQTDSVKALGSIAGGGASAAPVQLKS